MKFSTGDQVDKSDLSRARAICKWAPEWIEIILNGGGEFSRAFKIADERRQEAAQVIALMDRLAKEAPDLHALVLEAKGMTAAEGEAGGRAVAATRGGGPLEKPIKTGYLRLWSRSIGRTGCASSSMSTTTSPSMCMRSAMVVPKSTARAEWSARTGLEQSHEAQ